MFKRLAAATFAQRAKTLDRNAIAAAIAWACCLLPVPAAAATLTATPADVAIVLAAARPGDTVILKGVFPTIPRARTLSGVTLRAEGATVSGLLYPAGPVTGLTISGGTWAGVRIDNAVDFTVTGGAVFRGPDPADGYGVKVNGGRNIIITGAAFESLLTGIALTKVDGFRIEGSGFARMRSDGMTIGESRNGVIRRNLFHGTRISSLEHPDAVQLFSRPTSPPTADILIENNDVVGNTQGLAGFNHVRDGVDDGGFDRIVIRNNRVAGGYPHGIALYDARNSAVENNRVSSYPASKWWATINAPGVRRCGNVVEPAAGKPGVVDAPC